MPITQALASAKDRVQPDLTVSRCHFESAPQGGRDLLPKCRDSGPCERGLVEEAGVLEGRQQHGGFGGVDAFVFQLSTA